MSNKKYYIESGIVGSDSIWRICLDGKVVAHLHGGMSAVVALAACESLNNNFKLDGWTERLFNNTHYVNNEN